ncbi:hypothetical protein [Streptomyces scopuliridis]|uniref:hypothetical protein n=1 Tax=Streptomyces scopuliridis TaxID=452529 RepID=UPI0036914241
MREREQGLGNVEAESVMDCREKANDELTRNARGKFAHFEDLKSKAHDDALRMPNVRQRMAEWSACMEESGYSYATPKEAYSKWNSEDAKESSENEVSTARADVKCKDETKLVSVWFSAERMEEEKQERKHATYLRKLKEANQRYLENARILLSGTRQ